MAVVLSAAAMVLPTAGARQAEKQIEKQAEKQTEKQAEKQLGEVVISASRTGQRRFDAAAAIDSVQVDTFRAASPLVNLSELTSGVPGLQVRDRQNFAQDLQVSVRGFGTRSTFGVRGCCRYSPRILL